MLGDNLREMRKQKGMSQEELAARIHVVRQTVSKWEKNISVPDAEVLQRIAEEFDVSVDRLLGAENKKDDDNGNCNDTDEIAQQLARINEQLAVKNKRGRRIVSIIKTVLIVIAVAVVIRLTIIVLGLTTLGFSKKGAVEISTEMSTVDPLYSEEDVHDAVDALEKYFGKIFKGCELKRIGYSEEYTAENASGYVEKYGGQDVIILESEFVASDNEELTDGKIYSGWKWIMGRSGSDDWEVLEYQKQ